MRQIIKVLDKQTTNQIAAGEVVERPASVIKELVENSIDAGSSRIEIRLVEGGLREIRVTDNGLGMGREDCQMAFQRFATSKISNVQDLFKVSSLGFRGEALPSIASISKVQLTSKRLEDNEGTFLYLEGGEIISIEATGSSVGTDILIKDLFYNVPARKKFVSKKNTEASHSIGLVQKIAIAYPEISFQLWHNEQLIFTTSGLGNLKTAVLDVLGIDYTENTLSVNYQNNISINGLVSKNFFHRSNRDRQIFIVNGRIVRNRLIQSVLENAYSGRLPRHRYPIAILNLEVPSELVDVNVHPSKAEIKFSDKKVISEELKIAIDKSLILAKHIPSFEEVSKSSDSSKEKIVLQEKTPEYKQIDFLKTRAPLKLSNQSTTFKSLEQTKLDSSSPPKEDIFILEKKEKEEGFPKLEAIGQVFNSFIIAQSAEALYIIDQHGAHERICYENLVENFCNEKILTQSIMIPVLLDLNPVEKELLIDMIVMLADLGIIIEHFGGNDFLIRAVPQGFDGDEAAELVKDLLYFAQEKETIKLKYTDEALKLMACTAAVKAKSILSIKEQQALIEDLSLLDNPYTCPHGRPIIINFEFKELMKRFNRN